MNRVVLALALGVSALTASASAQVPAEQRIPIDVGRGDDERVTQTIVYGDDPCPTSASGEITVCARKPEEERYRIPEALRDVDRSPEASWAGKVRDYNADAAMGGCSVTGLSGCWHQFMDRAFRERRDGAQGRYAQLIQAEREKRLAGIDAEARAEQARVEEIERAYFEQQKQAADGAVEQAEGVVDAPAQE